MIEVRAERTVPAPPDDLWPLVSDPARLPEWFAFAERVEVLEGGDGAGQRRRQHGHWGKKRSEIDQVITRWEPGRALALRGWVIRAFGRREVAQSLRASLEKLAALTS